MASGIRRRARSTMRRASLAPPTCTMFTKGSTPRYASASCRWRGDRRRRPSAAAATLVAAAFALSHARPLAGPPAPPRAAWTHLAGHVHGGLGQPLGGAPPPAGPSPRSGSSSCSAPSSTCRGWPSAPSTCSGGRRAGAGRAPPAWRCCRPSPPASWPSTPFDGPVPADEPARGLRRVRAAAPHPRRGVLGRGRARDRRRRAVVGVAAAARPPARPRAGAGAGPGRLAARQRAHRRRHARPVGQRHAERPPRRRDRLRRHARRPAISRAVRRLPRGHQRAGAGLDPAPELSRSAARRRTLPPRPFGSASTTSTTLGHL